MILKGRVIAFSPAKDAWLRECRGIGFEKVMTAIERGDAYTVIKHSNAAKYSHQMMLEIMIDGYGYAIPFVIQADETVFMKTIYPSRKVTGKFRRSDKK